MPIDIPLDTTAFILLSGVVGLLIGSFLNVVIHRLPRMMEQEWRTQCAELLGCERQGTAEQITYTLAQPRSHCPHCQHVIRWYENIPVISYLLQRGKCSACGQPISLRYPLVEILSGLLAVTTAWHFGVGWQAVGVMTLLWALIALSGIDLQVQLLPDSITLPFLWLGIALNLFHTYTDLESSVIGAMAGYLTLWLVYMGFKLVTGKEGMGFGDFKLLAVIGAWGGWQILPFVIVASSFIGAIVGIAQGLIGAREKGQPIPFGPYLAGAGWIGLLWGPELSQAYFHWTGMA